MMAGPPPPPPPPGTRKGKMREGISDKAAPPPAPATAYLSEIQQLASKKPALAHQDVKSRNAQAQSWYFSLKFILIKTGGSKITSTRSNFTRTNVLIWTLF